MMKLGASQIHLAQCQATFIILFIFITDLVNLSQQDSCITGIAPYDNLYIQYGKPLDISCSIDNENKTDIYDKYFNKDLYFTQDGKHLSSYEIKQLNSSTIRLFIQKPRRSKSIYRCQLEDNQVCSNTVIVDDKPLPILDFDCISYNFQNLTCTWTAPKGYAPINYALTHHFLDGSLPPNACPKLISSDDGDNMLSCSWTTTTTPPYKQLEPELYFELKISNVFGETLIRKTLLHYQKVLPNPPEGLTYINKTSESIYLRWSVPSDMQTLPAGLQHRIMYRSEYGRQEWKFAGMKMTTILNQTKYVYFNLTGLKYAHASYEVRVTLRSLAATKDESMWSKFSNITTQTLGKLPEMPPLTNIGSFEIVSTSDNKTNATIYWQHVHDEMKNGEDFKYHVQGMGMSRMEPLHTTNNYVEFLNLDPMQDYTFRIWSENNFGRSRLVSTVFIPQLSERLELPTSFSIIPNYNGKYQFSWNPPSDDFNNSVINYTIFWCDVNSEDHTQQCSGNLHWKQTSNNATSFNITIPDSKTYQFAISANSETSSSGMIWNTCFDINNKGEGRLKNVWINNVYPTAIEVAWRKQCLDSWSGRRNLTIGYCAIVNEDDNTCKDNEQTILVEVDTGTNRVNISQLKPHEKYRVRAYISGGFQRSRPKHTEIFTFTLEDETPNPPEDLKVTNVSATSVSISWKNPNFTKEGEIRYEIFCTDRLNVTTKYDATIEKYIIADLMSYTDYKIYVKTCTSKECSEPSEIVAVKINAGVPSQVSWIHRRTDLNETDVVIEWEQPQYPKADFLYEVYLKATGLRHPISFYTTDTCYKSNNCNDTFYLTVRAVNVFDGERYEGPWSEEFRLQCSFEISIWLWALIPIVLAILIVVIYFLRRLYKNYQKEIDLDIVLPSGLNSSANTDIKDWGRPTIEESALAMKFLNGNLNQVINTVEPEPINQIPYTTKQTKNPSLPPPENPNINYLPSNLLQDANTKQYTTALPEHVNSLKQNLTEDDKIVNTCNTKSLTGDCAAEHEDASLSYLGSSATTDNAKLIKVYCNNPNDTLSMNIPGYVAVGNNPEENCVKNEHSEKPINGYVTWGTDATEYPPPVSSKQLSIPEIIDNKHSGDLENFENPIGIPNSTNSQNNGYTVMDNNLNSIEGLPPEGYVAVGLENVDCSNENEMNSKSSIPKKQNLPNGYVILGTDNVGSLTSNNIEDDDSNSVQKSLGCDYTAVPVQAPLPKGNSYIKLSEMQNIRAMPSANGYVTLPEKT